MKLILAQINTTPGDFSGNLLAISTGLAKAKDAKADLIVYPELAICGYASRDLFNSEGFVERNLGLLSDIVNKSLDCPGLTIVVGYVGYNNIGFGKPFTNMAAVIRNGAIIGTYQKHLLPNYDVFDERRYFESGTDLCIVTICGRKYGISICEDIWNDKGQDDYSYEDNPIASYRARGVNSFINISSSPFVIGKPQRRLSMLNAISEKASVIYVNQCGAQDELVFDGRSCFLVNGTNRYVAGNHEEFKFIDTMVGFGHPISHIDDTEDLYNTLITGIRDYFRKTGHKKAVLGSSGGIDSAVVAALACEALGPDNVTCIMMPSIYSSEGSCTHAKELHKNLGCIEKTSPIVHTDLIDTIRDDLDLKSGAYNESAEENLQARLRGMTVMFHANATGALALTTGNKTELAFGYCTLYGDMNGGLNCLGGLYKRQVFEIARYINARHMVANGMDRALAFNYKINHNGTTLIPQIIINKPPSAELKPGQTDEASLLPYGILDYIAEGYIEHHVGTYKSFCTWVQTYMPPINSPILAHWLTGSPKLKDYLDSRGEKHEGSTLLVNPETQYNKLIKLIKIMEFKRRQAAPCIKVNKIDFGTGRRLPIVQGHE